LWGQNSFEIYRGEGIMNITHLEKVTDEAKGSLTLRDLVAPLFRRRRLVITVFSGVFLFAILFAWLWAARYYVATMQIVVEQDRSDPAVTAGQSSSIQNSKTVTSDQVTSEVALLQGQDMLRSVVATCHLADDWTPTDIFLFGDAQQKRAMKLEKTAIRLGKSLVVEPVKLSDVIDVRYGKTGKPETPSCVLQTLGKLYLEKHLQLRRPVGSADFFAQETDKSRQTLANAEARLANFGREGGVAAPDVLRTYMAQQLVNSVAALYQAQQAIAADEQRIQSIQTQVATMPARSSTTEVSNSANVLLQQLQASLLAAQIKRTQLLLKFEPSYPLVREADQEIAETQDAIKNAQEAKYVNQTTDRDATYEFLREDLAKTQVDLSSQKATANALGSSIRNMRTQIVDLDGKAVEQTALIRDAKAAESNYLLYLSKREQERTSDALDQRKIADVAIAVPPVVPVVPAYGPFLVMFVGAFAAGFAGMAAGFAAEYLDPSFRTPQEVAETLKVRVLASFPRQAA
jgi:uncharacterized protein involved in exopolysaccharide biosynthesis